MSGRLQLQTYSLPPNYIINSLLEARHSSNEVHHQLLMENLTNKQKLKFKGPIVDTNNRLNSIFRSFDLFNSEFSPDSRLVDLFSDHFSFFWSDRGSIDSRKSHLKNLDEVVLNTLMDSHSTIIVSDMSIKNNVVTLIAHIHSYNLPVIKMIHYATNIISTEAELFAIRCGINQAVWLPNIKWIIVITNSIHAAENFFDLSVHSYQIQMASISMEIRQFFIRNDCNSLEFWNCPSKDNWLLHKVIDKETKKFNLTLLFPCKSS